MEKIEISWAIVDQVAGQLGATAPARKKWRHSGRRVPWEWRIKIADALKARGETVEMADFDRLDATPGRIAA